MCQLLGLRNQQGAANFTLGVGEETLVLLDHVFHYRGKKKKSELTNYLNSTIFGQCHISTYTDLPATAINTYAIFSHHLYYYLFHVCQFSLLFSFFL
jgi:hypothetical protein